MPSPFPGMDPYLEWPVLWPDVHHGLVSQCQAALNPSLRPRYVARVEMRVYISDYDDPGREPIIPDVRVERSPKERSTKSVKPRVVPTITEPLIVPTLVDEEVEEAFLKILDVKTDELVTLIEILSPSNKVRGSSGRKDFMGKRHQVMNTDVHWVEIDLLRAGLPTVTDPPLRPSDYRVLISRGDQRLRTRFWPISVRQPLPIIGIPLRGKEPEVPLDLGAVLTEAYDRACYDASVDYRKKPTPPLQGDDARWARQLLRAAGLR